MITAKDRVIVSGINGCERYIEDGCFITGHDPDNGKELWRTSILKFLNLLVSDLQFH